MTTTDWRDRFEELTRPRDAVLDDDLAALERTSERERIERYNELKANEETFVHELADDADLTSGERERVRSEFRLARLLVAASFYADGDLPRALAEDFSTAELQAAVDFDRYSAFDALDEDQIESRIRRMDGEVYELVRDYHSTQLANVDALLEADDVQRDVVRALVDRYEERFEKVRRGFFVYVETHGLEHVVETIEAAVTAVADSSATRDRVREQRRSGVDDAAATVERDLQATRREVETALHDVERRVAEGGLDEADADAELAGVEAARSEFSERRADAESTLAERVAATADLESTVAAEISRLEAVREDAADSGEPGAAEAAALVDDELASLREQREELAAEVAHLERQRDQLDAAEQRLADRQQRVAERAAADGVDPESLGEDAVTARMARLLELDYVGRFDESMHHAECVATPVGEISVDREYWDGRREHRSERATVQRLVGDVEAVDQYPVNRTARYELSDSRYLGLTSETHLVVEARVRSNLEAHTSSGFDAQPAGLDVFLDQVNELVHLAERDDHPYLVGLASPTGWTDRVEAQLTGDDARGRYSRDVVVCLVDLRDGSVTYDADDRLAAENAALFELEVPSERVQRCVDLVRSQYADDVGTASVLLEDVVANHDFDAPVVRRAFDRLAEDGVGRRLRVDDLGMALDFG